MERKRVSSGVPTGGQYARENRRKIAVSYQTTDSDNISPEEYEMIAKATKTAVRKAFGGNTGSALRFQDVVEDVTGDVLVIILQKRKSKTPEEWAAIKNNIGGYAYNTARLVMHTRANRYYEEKTLGEELASGTIVAADGQMEDGALSYSLLSSNSTKGNYKVDISGSKEERNIKRWDCLQADMGWDNVSLTKMSQKDSGNTFRVLTFNFGADWVSAIDKAWDDETNLTLDQKNAMRRWCGLFESEDSARTVLSALASFPQAYRRHVVNAMKYKMAAA